MENLLSMIKNIWLAFPPLLIIAVTPFVGKGQGKVETKNPVWSAGYSYRPDTRWWNKAFEKNQLKPPASTHDINLNYEFDYKNKIVLGAELILIDHFKDPGLFNIFEGYFYDAYAVRILPHAGYNFIKSKKFSLYGSMAAGLYYFRFKAIHSYTSGQNLIGFFGSFMTDEIIADKKQVGFDWAAAARARFFFYKNIAVFAEASVHKSFFQAGFSFGKRNKKQANKYENIQKKH